MKKMFNETLKKKFISTLDSKFMTIKYNDMFYNISFYEEKKEKDIYEFTNSELLEMFKNFNSFETACRYHVSFKRYFEYCKLLGLIKKNKLKDIDLDIIYFDLGSSLITLKDFIKNIDRIKREDEDGAYYAALLSAFFYTIKYEELFSFNLDNIDFVNHVISINGRQISYDPYFDDIFKTASNIYSAGKERRSRLIDREGINIIKFPKRTKNTTQYFSRKLPKVLKNYNFTMKVSALQKSGIVYEFVKICNQRSYDLEYDLRNITDNISIEKYNRILKQFGDNFVDIKFKYKLFILNSYF